MKQLRIDCEFDFNQDSVKRAIGDTTVWLEHLLANHTWAQHEMDDEAYVRLDILISIFGKCGPTLVRTVRDPLIR